MTGPDLEPALRASLAYLEEKRRQEEQGVVPISPHGEPEEGANYRNPADADRIVRDIEESDSATALRLAWPGSLELLESFHPDDRKRIGAAFHRRHRQLSKPGRELDAPIKTQEKESNAMSRMTLASIERGRRQKPFCLLVYGPEGVGKSSFAAGAPEPNFIGEARGTDELDVARFPTPERWEEVDEALTVVEREDTGTKTLVLDTLDFLERLIWDFVCRSVNPRKNHVKDFGFGDGYAMAVDQFAKLTKRLEGLQAQRGVNIVLLAQSQVRTFKNPAGDDYDQYSLNIDKRAASFIRAWPSAVLFANYRVYTNKGENDKRIRGISNGARVLNCNPNAAWHAKNRYGLPDEIGLSWEEFASHATGEQATSATDLIEQIRAVIAGGDERLVTGVEAAIAKAGTDIKKLEQVKDRAISRMKEKAA